MFIMNQPYALKWTNEDAFDWHTYVTLVHQGAL